MKNTAGVQGAGVKPPQSWATVHRCIDTRLRNTQEPLQHTSEHSRVYINNCGRISTATTIIKKNLILYEIKTPATNIYLLQRIKMQFATTYFYT